MNICPLLMVSGIHSFTMFPSSEAWAGKYKPTCRDLACVSLRPNKYLFTVYIQRSVHSRRHSARRRPRAPCRHPLCPRVPGPDPLGFSLSFLSKLYASGTPCLFRQSCQVAVLLNVSSVAIIEVKFRAGHISRS